MRLREFIAVLRWSHVYPIMGGWVGYCACKSDVFDSWFQAMRYVASTGWIAAEENRKTNRSLRAQGYGR